MLKTRPAVHKPQVSSCQVIIYSFNFSCELVIQDEWDIWGILLSKTDKDTDKITPEEKICGKKCASLKQDTL